MNRTGKLLLAALLFALLGFCAGWWVHARNNPTPEERAREAAEHLRKSFESLTR